MLDIIQLLPDSVANQIAAGEVIQRPASAVKELLENAIDAGGSRIRLILKDAGKTFIQVIDDGSGMSALDARLCFERHATSKIRSADDLFTLHTMGFRGEALASIAAIAQVELKTKRGNDEIGTQVFLEGSEVISQQPIACNDGTSITVKNLFYNVPARRNFLKSNPVETRHIIDEFTRVALAYPQIAFSLNHNDTTVYDLRSGNLRQRIAAVFGVIYNERLVPVEEETSIVKLEGFVGKPEFAKKMRGEQFFFVNNRFVKDAYLNHAVFAAFESMIPKDCYPSYFIKINIDPAKIDVNIHPTKTEIKFEDEKSIYAIMRAAVKRALGKFSVAPTIDFEQEKSFDIPLEKMDERPVAPTIKITPGYNPFLPEKENDNMQRVSWKPVLDRSKVEQWHQLHREIENSSINNLQGELHQKESLTVEGLSESLFTQLYRQYILVNSIPVAMIIDQQKAHERILYERFNGSSTEKNVSQQQLFPQPLDFSLDETALINELLPELQHMGFDLSPFGATTFVLHGAPEEVMVGTEKVLLHSILNQYMHHRENLKLPTKENLAIAIARQLSIKEGKALSGREMKTLVNDLLNCENPNYSPSGKLIILKLGNDAISKMFNAS